MSNKMLIDASHPEETRVVVTKGSRIEEFDFESEHKKQLKGNIYLARVTRVEPSLQAAFVEYGGNRHGFLAFSEIHPDYYQIPVADRQALLEAEEQSAREDAAAEHEEEALSARKGKSRRKTAKAAAHDDAVSAAGEAADEAQAAFGGENHDSDDDNADDEKPVDLVGAEDALEEVPARGGKRGGSHWRDYKIQEVIKRRQILLVQIVKEERGTKGAALTTYLSLAGRYSVLMPNTARGGGISRKITGSADRKRLKDIVKDLSVPRGMGVILRTAGASRTKAEVRRDYEYLMRLWENVRSLTLDSMAPALVYEEGSLIKRSIRDLYNKDIDEIQVAGDKAYREAKDFMRMLMPSHAKFVQPYRDPTPIFARCGIEAQLDGMLQPEVGLKSGGYLVMNQTEALVAIDVNSGRSTREHSVEETALQTNLEAAEEVARQLRLRDLAGLIVIDFIDMQEKRNIRAVEKRLKDCLKDDRARIQVGRISHFGLMEMSRQRIRASVLESTTQPCPHCFGRGYVRSQSSLALHLLRVIEEYLQRSQSHNIMVKTPVSTALYVLNHKRRALTELEERFGLTIDIEADDTVGKEHLTILKTSEAAGKAAEAAAEAENNDALPAKKETAEPAKSKAAAEKSAKAEAKSAAAASKQMPAEHGGGNEEGGKRRRRRGKRGGRHNRDRQAEHGAPAAEPVGAFAAQFTEAEPKAAMPNAEPVGNFAAPAKQGKKPKDAAKANAGAADAAAKADNFAAQKRRSGRNGKSRGAGSNDVSADEAAAKAAGIIIAGGHAAEEAESIMMTADNDDRLFARSRRVENAEREEEEAIAEPVVTSSAAEEKKGETVKKKGWWGRRNFF